MIKARLNKLKTLMNEHDITWRAIEEQFDITAQAARAMLHNETIIKVR